MMQTITLSHLVISAIPALLVIAIMLKWSLDAKNVMWAILRMLSQLLVIGYFLAFIFESNSAMLALVVLSVMICAASWIALGTVPEMRRRLFFYALVAILLGGGLNLLVITQGVLSLSPWYLPESLIPLAGMIFSSGMNAVSLAAERLVNELKHDDDFVRARNQAFQTSMIPMINSLFAVGLVALPGMMTGQILSGVSPLIAVRYQIMVMFMTFAAAGISSAIFLVLSQGKYQAEFTKGS
ncbi:MAG: putative ABC transport system permease protein [Paraglaciecola sp.]|jgi:putative ABC transport system permease protein